MSEFLKDFWWSFTNPHIWLNRFAEQLNARNYWGTPVKKIKGTHVSGDALAEWRFAEMPLPNIWEVEK